MPRSFSDESLLLGVLALQMGFISREQLTGSAEAWMLEESSSLGEVLRRQGAIDADSLAVLKKLVQKHLQAHGDDPSKSLAAADLSSSIVDDLRRLNKRQINATVDQAEDSGRDANEATEVFRPGSREDDLESYRLSNGGRLASRGIACSRGRNVGGYDVRCYRRRRSCASRWCKACH